jgi:damage-control phosphatase, subfamily I
VKRHPDCYPCLIRQTLHIARYCGVSEDEQVTIVRDAMASLLADTSDASDRHAHRSLQTFIRSRFGGVDPYRELKDQSTQRALALYPRLKDMVHRSHDRLATAVRLAIAGNIIDYGPADEYDLEASVARVLRQPLAVDDIPAMRRALDSADWVLYLADNAGETVFDRVLIEEITKPVTYAVKGGATGNDATMVDAVAAGLEGRVRLVDNGANRSGTVLDEVSPEFRALYDTAPVIIAKGMGNYETLSVEGPRLFFLLQAKCVPVAGDLGVSVSSLVVKRG